MTDIVNGGELSVAPATDSFAPFDPFAQALAPALRPQLSEEASGADAFETLARAGAERIAETAGAFLLTDDPEATRQLRVAMRRQRCLIKLFAPALSAAFVEEQGERLRPLSQALGAVREAEVIAGETLPSLIEALTAAPE
ncbi:MAG: CHAD domain-containing protein, partial [Pseudomonadota bacterium]